MSAYRSGPHPSPWRGPRTVLDILLNNLGVGLALAASVAAAVGWDDLDPVVWISFALAAAVIGLDLALLVLDLGDPLRFFHMLRVIRPRTPMSVGVWSLSVLMALLVPLAVLGVLAAAGVLPDAAEVPVRVLAALALVPGAGAVLYKGVLFSVTPQPGWRDARSMSAYASASGVLLGVCVVLGLQVSAAGGPLTSGARAAGAVAALVAAVPLVMLRVEVGGTLRERFPAARVRRLDVLVVVLGIVAPAVLLGVDGRVAAVWLSLALALGAAWLVRAAFVALAHPPSA